MNGKSAAYEIFVGKVIPWGLFFALAWLLKYFWGLIFLTYILGSLMSGLIPRMRVLTGATHKRAVVLSYFMLVCLITATGLLLVPQAWKEALEFSKTRLELFKKQANNFLKDNVPKDDYEKAVDVVKKSVEDLSPAKLLSDVTGIFQWFGRIVLFAFLSMIFSCGVLWDPTFIYDGLGHIQRSRAGWIYDEVAPPVATFFRILGRVFDAQIVIALVNTTLTLFGMIMLGIPGELFLSVVVFFCGLIPVIGAFLSSVPIVITALVQPAGGVLLAIKAIAMILIVHALEAYVLNPRIMGHHLKMHPLTVIATLLVGEHYFGIWGVLLGVPGITYLAHYFAGRDPNLTPAVTALVPAPETLPAPTSPPLEPPVPESTGR